MNDRRAYTTIPYIISLEITKSLKDFTNDEYLDLTKYDSILKDITKVLLQRKSENIESSLLQILMIFLKGENILLKPYGYVIKSKTNKLFFLEHFRNIWSPQFKAKGRKITGNDFYQLLLLLCNDAPITIVYESAKMASNLDTKSEKNFFDLEFDFDSIYKAFAIIFYHSEYMEELKSIYQLGTKPPGDIVLKPIEIMDLCGKSGDPNIKWMNRMLFTDEKLMDKGYSYDSLMQLIYSSKKMFEMIENNFGVYIKEIEKYEKLKKLIGND